MEQLKPVFEKIESACAENEENPVVQALSVGAEKTGVSRAQCAIGASVLLIIIILLLIGMSLISTLIGVIYPAYKSFKAIESPAKDDDTQWLVYWVVFGVITVLEEFTDVILFWLPLYYEMKCGLLVWCMFPSKSNGSTVLYNKVIRPKLLKAESDIDNAAKKVSDAVSDATKQE